MASIDNSEFTQHDGRMKRTAKHPCVTNMTGLLLARFVVLSSLNTNVMPLWSLGNLSTNPKCTCMSPYSRRHEHLPLGCRSWCFRSVPLHLRWQWWRVSTGNRGTFWPVHKRVGAVCSNVFKSQWCWCHSREWQDICNRYGMCNAQQCWNCTLIVVKGVQYFTVELNKVFFGHASTAIFCLFFSYFVRSLIVLSDRCAEFLNALFTGVDPGRGRGGWPFWGEPIRTQGRWSWCWAREVACDQVTTDFNVASDWLKK